MACAWRWSASCLGVLAAAALSFAQTVPPPPIPPVPSSQDGDLPPQIIITRQVIAQKKDGEPKPAVPPTATEKKVLVPAVPPLTREEGAIPPIAPGGAGSTTPPIPAPATDKKIVPVVGFPPPPRPGDTTPRMPSIPPGGGWSAIPSVPPNGNAEATDKIPPIPPVSSVRPFGGTEAPPIPVIEKPTAGIKPVDGKQLDSVPVPPIVPRAVEGPVRKTPTKAPPLAIAPSTVKGGPPTTFGGHRPERPPQIPSATKRPIAVETVVPDVPPRPSLNGSSKFAKEPARGYVPPAPQDLLKKPVEVAVPTPAPIPARNEPLNSNWVVRVEIHAKETHMFARSKDAEFRVICKNLKMQSPSGLIQAEGHVKVIVGGLDVNCDRLVIDWKDEWVLMEDAVRLETIKDNQRVILAGEQLRLKLTTLTSPSPGAAAAETIRELKKTAGPAPAVPPVERTRPEVAPSSPPPAGGLIPSIPGSTNGPVRR